MPRVRFTEKHNYVPSAERRWCQQYLPGWEGVVKQECADEAIRMGRAVLINPEDSDGGRPAKRKARLPATGG